MIDLVQHIIDELKLNCVIYNIVHVLNGLVLRYNVHVLHPWYHVIVLPPLSYRIDHASHCIHVMKLLLTSRG